MSSDQPGTQPSGQPSLVGNAVSYVGILLATASLASIIFILLVEFVGGKETPYIGVLLYLALPVGFILGLILIPVGMFLVRRRLRSPEAVAAGVALPRYPVLDLNNVRQRLGFAFFILSTLSFTALLAGLSYRAYGFMESVEFCGQLCHKVMAPEFTAYQSSPHARVTCVSCHIGAGADWFVRSKLSGLRQVLNVTLNTYPRPILAPIRDLRPARETCETCHWPEKFFGDQTATRVRYLADEANTLLKTTMIIKTGGGGKELGLPSGIHWHMNIKNQIEYVATDRERQQIPWVRLEDPDGRVAIYVSKEVSLTPDQLDRAEKRVMDCMDCHNRPTHNFRSPDESIDLALNAGKIDTSLPYVKREAVKLLSQTYGDAEAAFRAIDQALTNFYRQNYPEVYVTRGPLIEAAVNAVQQAYSTSIFPGMRVDWKTYADNIGHQASPGCFRCHDGKHVSADGRVIRQDCGTCHTLPAPVEVPARAAAAPK